MMIIFMRKEEIQKINAFIPSELLEQAQNATGKNITETVIEGLKQVTIANHYKTLLTMEGKQKLDIDIDDLRDDK